MSKKTKIYPAYAAIGDFLESVPELMTTQGETLHAGRNLIKVLRAPDGRLFNVKRYHCPSPLNAIVYSLGLRQPKGRRAAIYPALLAKAGIETPQVAAYIEERRCGLLRFSWLVTVQCPYERRLYEVVDDAPEVYLPLAEALGRMTARMHEAEMLHRDYSPGNILWREEHGEYRFSVVDINRMRFGKVSLETGCANFARLWGPKDFFIAMARSYASCRGFDAQQCIEATLRHRRAFWTRYARRHDVSFKLDL